MCLRLLQGSADMSLVRVPLAYYHVSRSSDDCVSRVSDCILCFYPCNSSSRSVLRAPRTTGLSLGRSELWPKLGVRTCICRGRRGTIHFSIASHSCIFHRCRGCRYICFHSCKLRRAVGEGLSSLRDSSKLSFCYLL